jgi:hypothetical protein
MCQEMGIPNPGYHAVDHTPNHGGTTGATDHHHDQDAAELYVSI